MKNEVRLPKCGECGNPNIELIDMEDDSKRWQISKVTCKQLMQDEGEDIKDATGIYTFEVCDDYAGFVKTEGNTRIECMKCHSELTDHEVFHGI